MRRETFETPGPLRLSVRVPSGRIELEATEGTETVVELDGSPEIEEEARIEVRPRRDGHEVVVLVEDKGLFRRSRGDVQVRVSAPAGADVEVSSASADVDGRGEFGGLEVDTASGDLTFDQVRGDAEVNSASGDVKISRVQGALTANTASGDVEVGYVGGNGKARSASGDVSIQEADSSLKIQTASGDVNAGSVREGGVTLQTASGDIAVGVKQGSKAWVYARTMSGETSSELELGDSPPEGDGPLVEISASAMSGDITVRKA